MTPLLKHPSAWLPVAMSATALAMLAGFFAMHGVVHQADEGTAAHLFQILMGGQVPIIAFFALTWLPRAPREALSVLGLQILSALLALAPVFYFQL